MSATGTVHWRVQAPWGEAEEHLLRIAPNARVRSGVDLRHRLESDGDERFSFLRFRLAGEFEASNEPDDTVTITSVTSGWMHWRTGEERGDGALPWMQSVTRPTSSRFGTLDEIALFLKQEPLLALGRALYCDERFRLDFDGALPVDEGHGRYFAELLASARGVATTDAFDEPLLRAALYRHVAVALLQSFRLRGDRAAAVLTAEGRLRRYRIAARFLEDHASLPITVEDAAQAAGVPSSDLEGIFRAHSPSGRGVADSLRAVRLAAAHDDLVRGDPTRGDTVRQIAHRWGFPDPSGFARRYRSTYGVAPKRVLDR